MNKWTLIIGGAFIVLLVVLFASGTEQYTPVENIQEEAGGIAQTVRTQPGDTFSLTLPNEAQEYAWHPIFNDAYISLEDTERNSTETVFTFEAKLQGATDISFVYESEKGDILEEHSTRVEIK